MRDSLNASRFETGRAVIHERYGRGVVRYDEGATVLVQFDHGIESCPTDELRALREATDAASADVEQAGLATTVRALAHCIQSTNDSWGVFSASRIKLLPHQLWVCKRVLDAWPKSWMVADDVGLGKTIEAGLILSALKATDRAKRILILTPASLAEQWQERLHKMFGLHSIVYKTDRDTRGSGFWEDAERTVIASLHTLRREDEERLKRIQASPAWDVVLVDEAHHLNVESNGRRSLSFQLVNFLREKNKAKAFLFFTGTPHRGKDRGFLELLHLLRPSEFDPKDTLESVAHKLSGAMIRNNKSNVTNMDGEKIFTPITTHRSHYTYSPEEAAFYNKMTDFIARGKAYANSLGSNERSMTMLVLIAMQKIASSSVAAVSRALRGRLYRLKSASESDPPTTMRGRSSIEELWIWDDQDKAAKAEEDLFDENGSQTDIRLNPDEIPALEELLETAKKVEAETKIEKIMELLDTELRERSVLFFTEYKATQALLLNELRARFGTNSCAFINGDGYLDGIVDRTGKTTRWSMSRHEAAKRLNEADVRFLVSTEAAGEGIDLQHNCHTLIHVDLPWNPMRLQQRGGRLSRYGQTMPVDVFMIRNPDTIESRIWDLLDQKLDRIALAFKGAMDDPEDLRELLIGTASPWMYERVFEQAPASSSTEELSAYVDSATGEINEQHAKTLVESLGLSASRFEYGKLVAGLPRVDLEDLLPFCLATLALHGKRPDTVNETTLAFRPIEEWVAMDDRIFNDSKYALSFSRSVRGTDEHEGVDTAGVGLRLVEVMLRHAVNLDAAVGAIDGLNEPITLFAVSDMSTSGEQVRRTTVLGVIGGTPDRLRIKKDWELIQQLNEFASHPRSPRFDARPSSESGELVAMCERFVTTAENLAALDTQYTTPQVHPLLCLLPGEPRRQR